MGKLDGKVAVVNGGNSGIGLATVKSYLREGAKVAITGRRQEALDEIANELSGEFITIKADAGDVGDQKRLIETVVDAYGKIDILFLNAGIAPFAPVAQTSEEVFDSVINTNLKGPYFTVQEAIPHLNQGSVVVFNTSIVDQKGFPNTAAYSISKAGLRGFVRVLASELAPLGVRSVAVAPGPIETPIYGKIGLSETEVQELGAGFAQSVPLGRFGSSEEVAETVTFLSSPDASYINGVEVEVDGGLSQV